MVCCCVYTADVSQYCYALIIADHNFLLQSFDYNQLFVCRMNQTVNLMTTNTYRHHSQSSGGKGRVMMFVGGITVSQH